MSQIAFNVQLHKRRHLPHHKEITGEFEPSIAMATGITLAFGIISLIFESSSDRVYLKYSITHCLI